MVAAVAQPVRPARRWSDARSAPPRPRLAERLGSDRAAYSLVPRLLWMVEQEPESVRRARWALQAWDFIACRLAGGKLGAASTLYLILVGSTCPRISPSGAIDEWTLM